MKTIAEDNNILAGLKLLAVVITIMIDDMITYLITSVLIIDLIYCTVISLTSCLHLCRTVELGVKLQHHENQLLH